MITKGFQEDNLSKRPLSVGFVTKCIENLFYLFKKHVEIHYNFFREMEESNPPPIPWRPINPNGAPFQDLQNGLKPKLEPKLDA